jgi:hypothetical protein
VMPRAWRASAVAVLAVLCACPGGNAASGPLDTYNPKEDPNYRRAITEKQASWERILSFIAEFEALQPASTTRRESGPQPAVPQTPSYTAGEPPPRPLPDVSTYGALFGYPLYGDPFWRRPWRHESPRIPWWSLLPFTKDDRHRRDVVFPRHLPHK